MNALSNNCARIQSIFALLFYLASPASARDKPAALQALEDDFEKNLSASIQTLYGPYRAALDKLYKTKVKSGKLEEALAVKKEIERIKLTLPSTTSKTAQGTAVAGKGGSFLLLASNAELTGSIRFDKASGRLIGWNNAGSAQWKLDNLPTGTYLAKLHYHSGPFAGGKFKAGTEKSRNVYTIRGSGKWQEKKQLNLGEVSIANPAPAFTLSILDSRTQGIMELSNLTLTPKQTQAPAGNK